MLIFTALVIGDATPDGINSFAAEDPAIVRSALIEFCNQTVEDGGLDDGATMLAPDAAFFTIQTWVREHLGRTLVYLDMELLTP